MGRSGRQYRPQVVFMGSINAVYVERYILDCPAVGGLQGEEDAGSVGIGFCEGWWGGGGGSGGDNYCTGGLAGVAFNVCSSPDSSYIYCAKDDLRKEQKIAGWMDGRLSH